MVAVATRYGETGASPYLLPISVDGLVVVASVSLVELAGRIRTTDTGPDPAPAGPAPVVAAVVADTSTVESQPVQVPARVGVVPVPAAAFARPNNTPTRTAERGGMAR
jgi:hypothetical protein